MKTEKLGWIVAAALAGAIVGMGFDGSSEKTGSVDMVKVFQQSDLAKKQTETLQNALAADKAVLQFIQANMHMKPDDAKRFRDLSVKEDLAPTEKTELERIKSDAQTNESNFSTLNQKANPSPTEIATMEGLNKQGEANRQLLGDFQAGFSHDLDSRRLSLQDEAMQRVKEAVQQVAKKQGYSVVYSQEATPYTANDITSDALNQLNTNKK